MVEKEETEQVERSTISLTVPGRKRNMLMY